MERTIDDTIVYVLFLTRHIRGGDVPAALLALLVELGFSPSWDGFGYLRKIILMRYENPDLRFNELYREVGQKCVPALSSEQVEQAIRSAIDAAWKNRDDTEWRYIFPNRKGKAAKRPSNGDFIATMACVMELWCSGCREVYYETK